MEGRNEGEEERSRYKGREGMEAEEEEGRERKRVSWEGMKRKEGSGEVEGGREDLR